MVINFNEEGQLKKLKELRKQDEEALAQVLAKKYHLDYIDLGSVPVDMEALRLMPEADAREAKVATFNKVGKKVSLGILTKETDAAKNIIKRLENSGYDLKIYVVSNDGLEKVWGRYKDLSFAKKSKAGSLEISNEDIEKEVESIKNLTDAKQHIEKSLHGDAASRISSLLEITMSGALATGASDVHFEPEEAYVRLRYRLDGVLNNIIEFDKATYNLLLSRIKLLSGLKLNIKKEAQDGRFSIKYKDTDIEIRTSILPGAYNESIVLRILNPKAISVPLEELGIEKHLLDILIRETKRPDGLILTTGPTGSGKTTTLYAFLKKIHNPDVKIITIEDPIEYHLPGIVQTQVDKKKDYTFLSGLRSALRQDPDIIMVGEIRDDETAEIAINSALTGHLVFSTLHTNSAAGTFPRLVDLGIDPKIITSAINISMAQRLLRRLCKECKKEAQIDDKLHEEMKNTLSSLEGKVELPKIERIYEAKGCVKCNGTGYKGRIGIYEAILTDSNLEQVLQTSPSEREIKKATESQGIPTMKQDGYIKILKGITSLDELERIIDLTD